MASHAATDGTTVSTASTASTASNGRALFKGRVQPPRRDLLSTTTTTVPIGKHELTLQSESAEPLVIEVDSTAVRQPFLDPDTPLGQPVRGTSS